MAVLSVDNCIEEASRLLAKASDAANDADRLRLLQRATKWLEEAKQRAAEQWAPANERPDGA